jgi:ADP-ribose pyrophosphatase
MNEPIVPTETRKIYEGRIFTLQIETVTLPKGGELKAEVIRHPGSVVIIPRTHDGKVVLVRQYRPAIGRWVWELPAGSLKPGESIEPAARRECHEETGRIAGSLTPLGGFYPTPGYCDEKMNVFLATDLRDPAAGDEQAHMDEDEDIETGEFTRDQLRSMIASNEIVDLKTVAGLALLDWSS